MAYPKKTSPNAEDNSYYEEFGKRSRDVLIKGESTAPTLYYYVLKLRSGTCMQAIAFRS